MRAVLRLSIGVVASRWLAACGVDRTAPTAAEWRFRANPVVTVPDVLNGIEARPELRRAPVLTGLERGG